MKKLIYLICILILPSVGSSQILDVDGSLKIKNSNDPDPEAGTIRWNSSTDDFEGFNGSVWVSLTKGNSWKKDITESSQNVSSDINDGDWFAHSVSIIASYAIIGAPFDDDDGTNSGSAYIFKKSGGEWTEQTKLTASDAFENDNFGYSVAINGNYAIVGAPSDDDGGTNSGSAYIFVRSGTVWTEQDKLTASDGVMHDQFGRSVGISGDYAIAGARYDDDNGDESGSAYIFVRSGTSWSEQDKLLASNGTTDDEFGYCVAIAGDYAVVGAPEFGSGSAYVFNRSGTSWSEQDILTLSNPTGGDRFGFSVAISGNYAIVGAPRYSNKGAALIYERMNLMWVEQKMLFPPTGINEDEFGYSVSIASNNAAVGMMGFDGFNGNVNVYTRFGDEWERQASLVPSDSSQQDFFATAVAIFGDFVLVGGRSFNNKGAAFFYK